MDAHIEPSEAGGRALQARGIEGPVLMLNLLRFRDVADYARSPELAPPGEVSGADAYRTYAAHTAPHLAAVGGEVVLTGTGGAPLIGPDDERWDLVLVVRYPSVDAFLTMAGNEAYLAGVGHRTAALADSRLVPLEPASLG